MNSVILIGRLTKDVELRYSANQTAVARFTLAVERQRNQNGDQGADFIRIVVFGKAAESADRYLSKGRQVAIRGRINTGSYKDQTGRTVYTTDVIADSVEYLGGRSDNGGQNRNTDKHENYSNNNRNSYADNYDRSVAGGNYNNNSYDNNPSQYQPQSQYQQAPTNVRSGGSEAYESPDVNELGDFDATDDTPW